LNSNLITKIIWILLFTVSLALFAKVNINTANSEELQTLSGIGPKKAERIIKYREEHGKFKQIDDLTEVYGIGKKTLERLKPDIEIISDSNTNNLKNKKSKIKQDIIFDKDDGNPDGKININLADLEEFSMMPGIGELKGINIIEYRNKHGYFKNKKEIIKVKGIGIKTYKKLSVFITTKININTITPKELRKVKGVNQKFITKIKRYRKKRIKITPKKLNKLLKKYKMMKLKNYFWIKK